MARRISGIEAVRARELTKIFNDRCGPGALPADRKGKRYVAVMLATLAGFADASKRMRNFLELRAPWFEEAQRDVEISLAVMRGPTYATADELAHELDIDMATRQRLGLKTIGATDCDLEGRKAFRRKRHAEAERKRRAKRSRAKRAAGEMPADTLMRMRALECALSEGEWIAATELARAVANWHTFRGLTPRSVSVVVTRLLGRMGRNVERTMTTTATGRPRLLVRLRPTVEHAAE
jgi:hypothetical protein